MYTNTLRVFFAPNCRFLVKRLKNLAGLNHNRGIVSYEIGMIVDEKAEGGVCMGEQFALKKPREEGSTRIRINHLEG